MSRKAEEKPSKELLAFAKTVKKIIGATAEKYRFSFYKEQIDSQYATIIYFKPGFYIKISASIDFRDAPSYYNVSLGAGDAEKDYTQWYAVALWWLKQEMAPHLPVKEYAFPLGKEASAKVSHANNELLEYGKTFLEGDLTLFNKVVKAKNKGI